MAGKKMSQPGGDKRITGNLKSLLRESSEYDGQIVTPVLTDWLLANPDWYLSEKVAQQIAKVASTRPRDRSGTFSGSGAGLCPRRQELAFLGLPAWPVTDKKLLQIFANGKWVHLRWQAMLLEAGILDNIEVGMFHKRFRVKGSMDGTGCSQAGRFIGRDFGFELKGRNDFAFNSQSAKGVDDKTRKQVDRYFLVSGLDLFVIVNENKNDQDWKEWVFVRDESRVKEQKEELKELNEAIDKKTLHSKLPECKRGEGEWKKCPFGGDGFTCDIVGRWP